jgi:hypothetical protein
MKASSSYTWTDSIARQEDRERKRKKERERNMTTIVAPNRVTSSSSSTSTSLLSQQQQQHHNNQNNNEVDDDVRKKDENNDDNNNEHNQNNNNNNNKKNSNNSFFDDWKKGNWCWERDYDKYPVVLFSNNNSNCLNNNVEGTTMKVEEKNDEDSINNDDAYLINDRTRRDDIKNASDPGITGKGDNDDDDNDDDDDIDDDDSFYDDWVEGNWCLLDNYKNSNNNKNSNNDNNDDTSRETTCTQNNNSNNNNNESSKRKRKRSSDDDDNEDEDIYEEEEEEEEYYDEENKDGNDDDDDGEFLPDDNNDVRNHQEDERSAVKNSTRGAYNSKYQSQVWMEMFKKLVEYKKLCKNTMVPCHSKEVAKLGHWVSTQRKAYKKDKLLPRRLALLNSIDFVWEVHSAVIYQASWMEMFEKLVRYKKLHENTLVPRHCEEFPKLGQWIVSQRYRYKNDQLLPNRIDLLNSIDFEWDMHATGTYQALWMNMFKKLIEYNKQHKNTMVPKRYEKDPKLGHWVILQRCYYNNDKILPQRLDLLNSIDFTWNGSKAVR